MSHILLLVDDSANRQQLCALLTLEHTVEVPSGEGLPTNAFDLAIVDETALIRLSSFLEQHKQSQVEAFLPILGLISSPTDNLTKHITNTLDEIISSPLNEQELKTRIASLLQTRRLSLQLQQTQRLLQQETVHHQQLEREMSESEQRATRILESVSDAFFALDYNWRLVYINAEAERLLFKNRNSVLGNNLWDEFPEAVDSTFYTMYHKVRDEGVAVQFEEFYPPLDTWFEVRAYPSDEGIAVYFHDITQSRLAEAARRDSETRYRTMTEVMPQIVWTGQADGSLDYFNQRCYDYTGLTFEQIRDWGWQAVIHPDDLAQTLKLWQHSLDTGVSYEVEHRFKRADGVYRWQLGRAIPLKNEEGHIISWFGTSTDIDDQKRAEQNERFLTHASKILASLLDYRVTLPFLAPSLLPTLGDGCFIDVIGLDGKFERLATAQITTTKTELIQKLQQYAPDHNANGIIMQTFKSGKTQFVPEMSAALLRANVEDQEQIQVLLDLGIKTIMVVPLIARAHTYGTIAFAHINTTEQYSWADQKLAEELAYRVALAIDNARLYEEAQEASRRKDESLALLDTLLMTAPVGLAFFDRQFRYVRINEALAEINGVAAADHLGKTVTEVLPEIGPSQEPLFQQVVDTGEPLVNLEGSGQIRKNRNAKLHWLASYYPVRTPDGEMLGIGAVVADITERRRAEEDQSFLMEASTLLSSSLDYQVTLQNLTRLAVSRLADWCIIDVREENDEFRRLAVAHSDPAKEYLVQSLRQYPPNASKPSCVVEVVENSKSVLVSGTAEYTKVAVASHGEDLTVIRALGCVAFMVVPLMARGRTLGAMSLMLSQNNRTYTTDDLILAEELAWRAALAIDNARLYQEAQKAIEAQRELDSLKDRFLSIASHELRTPLTSIKGFTQILRRDSLKIQEQLPEHDFERTNRILDNLIQQSNRMDKLINEMLDISRLHSGQLELHYNSQTDLVELIRRIVQQQQDTTNNHTLILHADQPSLIGMVDENRVEQVLNNLINNAIKYSPLNTNVEIGVKATDSNEVTVSVRDYGYGIAPEYQVHIFDQFYRARNRPNEKQPIDGLGLGLFISREIVTRHGGQMGLTSVAGEGSTFYFTLPLNGPAEPKD